MTTVKNKNNHLHAHMRDKINCEIACLHLLPHQISTCSFLVKNIDIMKGVIVLISMINFEIKLPKTLQAYIN